jgi:UDP-N-acetylmuramate--alanine ligase
VTPRSPAEIGAGLEPARAPRPLSPGERVHVVGAAGAAAAAAALHALGAGAAVTGCDSGGPSQYTPPLEAAGIALAWEHAATHVASDGRVHADRLAVTKALTAVDPDHPELLAARRAGVVATSVQQLIADSAATRGQRLVAIAGTHGKSTTAGWVVHLLVAGGLDPSAFVGALMPAALAGASRPSTARFGDGPFFVVEADEYAGNFDPYHATIGALLNADWDHPDVFADRAAVVDAFAGWVRGFARAGETPELVANVGDAGVRETLASLRGWDGRLLAVALTEGEPGGSALGALQVRHATVAGAARALVGRPTSSPSGEAVVEIAGLAEDRSISVSLALPGRHNAANALVAAGVALAAGVEPATIADALGTYTGVGRRLEVKGEIGGVLVLDDYGHHPTAIAATFEAVAQRHPGRRLWAVYEPLTYHRTAAMLDAFAEVLERADRVVIAQVHAGRDRDTTSTSAGALAAAVRLRGSTPAWAPGTVEETADWLATRVEPGDVVLVMGGGRSYVIADRLVAMLRAREG